MGGGAGTGEDSARAGHEGARIANTLPCCLSHLPGIINRLNLFIITPYFISFIAFITTCNDLFSRFLSC